MTDNSRIDDLRRRVQQDPASIAFAQLAEEYRRAGQCEESVQVCQAGLAIHPGYLSARVTLGRALLELGQLDQARLELERVLKSAPENLAALRGLAEIYHRQGALAEALSQYKLALSLARNDPELEHTVEQLSRELAPAPPPGRNSAATSTQGISVEEVARELAGFPRAQRMASTSGAAPAADAAPPTAAAPLAGEPRPAAAHATAPAAEPGPAAAHATSPAAEPGPAPAAGGPFAFAAGLPADEAAPLLASPGLSVDDAGAAVMGAVVTDAESPAEEPASEASVPEPDERAGRTVAALEQFLAAIHGSRPQRRS